MIIIQGNNVLCGNCDASHPLELKPRMCDTCGSPIEGWVDAQRKLTFSKKSWDEIMLEDLYADLIRPKTTQRETFKTSTVVDLFQWGA